MLVVKAVLNGFKAIDTGELHALEPVTLGKPMNVLSAGQLKHYRY